MSNKMLTKRLLAAGMSIALSATLFATNGLTAIAAEESEAAVEAFAGPGVPAFPAPPSGEPEEAPEEVPEDVEPIATEPTASDLVEEDVQTLYQNVQNFENKDGTISRTITDVTVVEKKYYSDAENEDPDAEDKDAYLPTTKEDIDSSETPQHCDFVEVNEKKYVSEEHIYLEDNEGNKATYKTFCGQEVPIELSDDFTVEDLKEADVVQVIECGPMVKELNGDELDAIVYGYFDENGVFVKTEQGADKALPYYPLNGEYLPTNVVYQTQIKNDAGEAETAYLDKATYEEALKALNGEESTLTVEREYTRIDRNGKLDKKDKKTEAELEELENTEKAKIEASERKYNVKVTNIRIDPKPAKINKIPSDVYYDKFVVTGEANENGKYPVDYYCEINGNRYVVKSTRSFEEGAEIAVGYYEKDLNIKGAVDRDTKFYAVKEEPQSKNYTITYITIKNADGEVIFEGSREAFDELTSYNVMEVEDKIKIEDHCATYYVDKKDYKIIKEHKEKLFVTESFYYTVEDKTETNTVNFEMGGKDYTLTVDFWQNSRIGITGIKVIPNEAGTEADIIVEYDYSKYDDEDETNPPLSYTKHVTVDHFSSLGEARMSINYMPVYFATKKGKPFRPVDVRTPMLYLASGDQLISAADSQLMERRAFAEPAAFALYQASEDLVEDILEEVGYYFGPTGYEATDIHRTPFARNRVRLIAPEPEWVKGEEPAPEPTPIIPRTLPVTPVVEVVDDEPSPYGPTPTTIEETFVALAAAPAGQVLGAQREEAVGEAPAVLGASRARGTADETTAPIVRVIVMAAVAGTALFLTKKREENN